MILLTDEEIKESYALRSQPPGHKVVHRDIAKAQLRKVVESLMPFERETIFDEKYVQPSPEWWQALLGGTK